MNLIYPTGIIAVALFLFSSCAKKLNDQPPAQSASLLSANQEETVITPFGVRLKSQVHLIEDGYHLDFRLGHLLKVHTASGKVAEDFGIQLPVKKSTTGAVIPLKNARGGNQVVQPGLGSGWITFAENGAPVNAASFSTQWTVPSVPTTNDGQLLYIFNGLEDGGNPGHILQPVLQFGSNNSFGGNYWVIDNWYASCQTCPAYYGSPETVTPGTVLVGHMSGTASTGGTYNYTSSFYSILSNPAGRIHFYPTSNNVSVTNVPQLTFAYETIEAYNMQQYSDYPADNVCPMTNIAIYAPGGSTRPGSGGPLALNWVPFNVVTDVGQHTIVVSPQEVDLYFH
jgi:hypothetical protein